MKPRGMAGSRLGAPPPSRRPFSTCRFRSRVDISARGPGCVPTSGDAARRVRAPRSSGGFQPVVFRTAGHAVGRQPAWSASLAPVRLEGSGLPREERDRGRRPANRMASQLAPVAPAASRTRRAGRGTDLESLGQLGGEGALGSLRAGLGGPLTAMTFLHALFTLAVNLRLGWLRGVGAK